MIVQRDIIEKIAPFLERRECIAVIGPRQAGKTTLLQMLREQLINHLQIPPAAIREITFEDLDLRAAFEADPSGFIRSLIHHGAPRTYFLLDEYQYIRDGGQKLKFLFDTQPDIKLIVTGSSSLDLQWQVSKYMVGRLVYYHLYPFNFHEFLIARDPTWENLYHSHHRALTALLLEGDDSQGLSDWIGDSGKVDASAPALNRLLEEYCTWGSYPGVVLAPDPEIKRRLLRDIYNAFVLRDVKDLLALATDRELLMLSRRLSTQTGHIVVYKNLSAVSGLEFKRLKQHLHILTETFIIAAVPPYFRNKQKELVKNPKIYFVDPGLRNHLINNFNPFIQRGDVGQLVENFVWRHLRELFDVTGSIHFWRTKGGSEVDFVVERRGALLPIEVKYEESSELRIPRPLMRFVDSYHPPIALVLTKQLRGQKEYNGCRVYFMPVCYL